MKKKILIGVGVILIAFVGFVVYLNIFPASPPDSASISNNGLDISVKYSRPFKKGRLIFGDEKDKALQPYGKYWRLGANAATEITFNKNVNFAGKPVNAGTYRMYAVPGAESFQVSLNSETGVFLAVREPNYQLDVLKVDVPVTQAPETEQFTINFANDSTGVKMNFLWDKIQVTVPITAQ
ncbi:MAG TPA: hypothetical protein DGG95_14605 [Cytophagales bacterium]|jgi:hypothetical protein|nr:hypothetical protein [Cytophagales bacterium]